MSSRKPVIKDCFKARKGLCVDGDSYLDGDVTITGDLIIPAGDLEVDIPITHVMTRSSLQITTPHGDTGQTTDYTPEDTINTTLAWWSTDDTSTINTTINNTVTSWTDKTTSAYLLSASGDPKTNLSQQNSLNLIDIDDETDSFSIENFTLPANGDVLFFIACDPSGVNNIHDSILSFDAPSQDFQIQANDSSVFKGRIWSNAGIGANGSAAATTATSGIYCAAFDFTSGVYNLIINGTQIGTDSSYTTKLNPTGTLKIFENRGSDQWPTGNVAEVIVTDDVSDSAREKIEGYLAHKWDYVHLLPSDHTYKTEAPQTPIFGPVEEYFSMQSSNNSNDAVWDDITYDHTLVLPYQARLKRVVLRCSASQGATINLSMHTNRDETDPNTIDYKFFPQQPIETQTQYFTTNNEPRVYTFTPQASANIGNTLGISISANRVVNHSNATIVLEYIK